MLLNDVLEKLYAFCAYQERCKQDVIKKLNKLEIPSKFHSDYLQHLEEEKFINEFRYADAFTRGKIRQNKWGRIKIKHALFQKGIPSSLIEEAFSSINEEEYLNTLKKVLMSKQKTLRQSDPRVVKYKLVQYAAGKGFESGIIYETLEEITRNLQP